MLVEFIIPTYDRKHLLECLLSSLTAQTNKNWKATIVVDRPYSDSPSYLGSDDDTDDRITYIFLDKRYNDWGHTPREIGKQQSTADYTIMTGDDNYYTPNFVDELEKAAKDRPGMIYWDMVHSHYDYSYFKCSPVFNQIDMGAFATRTDLAKQIPLGKEYAADGLFVENFKHSFPNEVITKIHKILFVHN